jgi:bacterioferritin (cytochrome b1)
MQHAEELIARILFFKSKSGAVNPNKAKIRSSVVKQHNNDREAEMAEIRVYNEEIDTLQDDAESMVIPDWLTEQLD